MVVVGLCALTLLASAAEVRPNKDCLDCHEDKELNKTNAAGKTISLYTDEARLKLSVHKTNLCVACHTGVSAKHPDDNLAVKPVDCAICHKQQSESYGTSVHGLANHLGTAGAATCTDCHGQHQILPPNSIESPLHWSKLTQTCGECHAETAKEVRESVHGQATAKGNRESATCTSCHSEHKIIKLKGASSMTVSGDVCARCHASERISTKFHLPANRVKTFFGSYHGLAVQSGSARAANCASCHGAHKILPSNDPLSTINTNHLMATCGKCHPGATENFTRGKVHVDEDSQSNTGELVNHWVRRIYLALIALVIGGLGLHNGVAWLRKIVAAYRSNNRSIVRMDAAQRWQHFALLSSFVILALSGFALKYPDSWLAWLFGANENFRRWVHRWAGVVLLGAGCWHLIYVWTKVQGRRLIKDLWPRKQDFWDLVAGVKHLFTGKGAEPKFGRFGYVEKLEYWAVVWGTIIMGVTGLMIWFKMDVTRWLPRWAVDVATTVHYYEAILACLAIVVWHFYHVIFDPSVYPMNWAWLDGKVSAKWVQEHHPLDSAVNANNPVANDGEIVENLPKTENAKRKVPSAKP